MGTIIAISAILVPLLVVAVVLFFVFRRDDAHLGAVKARMAEIEERAARARPASARVVSSRTRGTFEEGAMAFVDLRLEVQPTGAAPYLANTEWEMNMSSLSMVEQGKPVAVKVDGEDPGLVYPDVGWAKLSRTYVARGVTGKGGR
ncbi:hypothetical protein [Sorangium sp. So ce513]|uniref:hypothetical protein n=1 Tax=Sorangium sp. So ce513 TaxID=3133315 RepID=UPI003F63FBEC